MCESKTAPDTPVIPAGSSLGRIALVIGIAFSTLNCAMTQEQFEAEHWDVTKKGPIPTFEATNVETLTLQMLPNSGVFYIYHVSENGFEDFDVAGKLRRLYALGINVSHAWYRPGLSGCIHPGSDATTNTMYPVFLLLHLERRNETLRKYNFYEIARPSSLPCPYRVSIFYPRYP